MPAWLEIALLVVVAVIVALFVAGMAVARRSEREGRARFERQLEEADRALAQARADDRGWERASLEAAVREALASRHPDVELNELALLQVIDLPGVEEDEAVFLARAPGHDMRVRLVRRGGTWAVGGIE